MVVNTYAAGTPLGALTLAYPGLMLSQIPARAAMCPNNKAR